MYTGISIPTIKLLHHDDGINFRKSIGNRNEKTRARLLFYNKYVDPDNVVLLLIRIHWYFFPD